MANKLPPATELTAAPPVLALFQAGPLAVLRIHDMAFSEVVSAVVKTLPRGVTSLMLVTPTDTKMFNLKNGRASYAELHGVPGDHPGKHQRDTRPAGATADAGAGDDVDTREESEEDPQEAAIRLAAEGDQASRDAGLEGAQAEAATAETPAARRRALKKIRDAETSPAGDPCRRCNGSGQIGVILEGGGSTLAACNVCRGAGVIKRFGERRR